MARFEDYANQYQTVVIRKYFIFVQLVLANLFHSCP